MTGLLRPFHQMRWNEPIIYQLGRKGQRGILVPEAEPEISEVAGDGLSSIPEKVRRSDLPNLPEMAQPHVVRHFNHLSHENLGADSNIDIGQGTCTMKHSPKINETFARSPKVTDLHPYQDQSTVQGVLEVIYRTGELFKEISGLDCCSIQPGGGSHGALAMACMVRAWHRDRGEDAQRDEVITTLFSHPADAAVPKAKGYKVIILPPDEEGLPDLEAYRNAVSERTAAICLQTPKTPGIQPQDPGVHGTGPPSWGPLLLRSGQRKRAAWHCESQGGRLRHVLLQPSQDLFITPRLWRTCHRSCNGGTKNLRSFCPFRGVKYDEIMGRYFLDFSLPKTCGKVKAFFGVVPVVLRAYAWIMSLGAEGLEEASRTAILNNNYFMKKMLQVRGCSMSYPKHPARIEQVRYSWEELKEDTGFGTADVQRRIADFGTHYWGSHEPFVIPEPFTIEPSESYSKDDLDEYLEIMEQISRECYEEPDIIRHAPHNSTVHHIDHDYFDDPEKWAITWREYNSKYEGYFKRK